ncbi:phosphonate ABC transporter, permease protein PhnE [Labrys wisconsinensis]|uniref:Phosphonate transport system permease protein n=1 Tax=Labrys wisconsinensis TaxID=425677 RepID=A0ABU0JD72_9HYPH|nr:phosphonate ABC transporter, permease protein PhnE [Labrys wisconsinensis]MDQ0471209.1 phosphonate transport system permease protein [Labrys wisconsinensis]
MPSALPRLPDRQAAALIGAYRRSVAARRNRTLVLAAVFVVLILLSGHLAEVRPGTLVSNIANFGNYLAKTVPSLSVQSFGSDVKAWYWNFPSWLKLLGETLLISYLGTLFGGLVGFSLCFLASANLVSNRWLRLGTKRLLEFCRTVPSVVFALLFVIAFGLGPMAGVLALTIHTAGALGKLFAEVVENIDMKPVEGLSSTGAGWVQTVRFAVLPQVLANFTSYSLLRFEINVREAGVMGFVGAGGIGQEFLVAIRNFYYTDVSAILLMIVATVITIDLLTEQLRHRLTDARGVA